MMNSDFEERLPVRQSLNPPTGGTNSFCSMHHFRSPAESYTVHDLQDGERSILPELIEDFRLESAKVDDGIWEAGLGSDGMPPSTTTQHGRRSRGGAQCLPLQQKVDGLVQTRISPGKLKSGSTGKNEQLIVSKHLQSLRRLRSDGDDASNTPTCSTRALRDESFVLGNKPAARLGKFSRTRGHSGGKSRHPCDSAGADKYMRVYKDKRPVKGKPHPLLDDSQQQPVSSTGQASVATSLGKTVSSMRSRLALEWMPYQQATQCLVESLVVNPTLHADLWEQFIQCDGYVGQGTLLACMALDQGSDEALVLIARLKHLIASLSQGTEYEGCEIEVDLSKLLTRRR